MAPRGWYSRYAEILAEFGYSRIGDERAAKRLGALAGRRSALGPLRRRLGSKDVFAVGAGPSLSDAVKIMRRFPDPVRVVADSAVSELVRRKIRIDVVVSDLDGDQKALLCASRAGAIMVVHAHADNVEQLELASRFSRVVCTTQSRPSRCVHNFGGFTDGDRCVFVASAMRAKSITLLGMDFGPKIGKYSMTPLSQAATKRKKIRRAKALLVWAAPQISKSTKLYTASGGVLGFKRVSNSDLVHMFV